MEPYIPVLDTLSSLCVATIEHHAVLNTGLIRKLFAEVINQLTSRVTSSSTSTQSEVVWNHCRVPLLAIRRTAGLRHICLPTQQADWGLNTQSKQSRLWHNLSEPIIPLLVHSLPLSADSSVSDWWNLPPPRSHPVSHQRASGGH